MANGVYSWSTTAGSNSSADANINWAEGQLPSSVNDSARAMMAAIAAMIRDQGGYAATGGSSTAYTLSCSQTMAAAIPALIGFRAHTTNTGACTLNVDALGASPLRAKTGVALPAGAIVSGCNYLVTWNSSSSEWLLINPAVGAVPLDGGTMTGALTLSGAPTVNLHAATKKYVDDTAATSLAPSGSLTAFAGTAAPSGWLVCDGSAISRTTYSALFTAIGTTWGTGDGSSTFNIPDLRGAFLRGSGDGLNPATRSVGSYEADGFKSHTHTAYQDSHNHSIPYGTIGGGPYSGSGVVGGGSTATSTQQPAVYVNATGGTETVPKNFAVLYIIKT